MLKVLGVLLVLFGITTSCMAGDLRIPEPYLRKPLYPEHRTVLVRHDVYRVQTWVDVCGFRFERKVYLYSYYTEEPIRCDKHYHFGW